MQPALSLRARRTISFIIVEFKILTLEPSAQVGKQSMACNAPHNPRNPALIWSTLCSRGTRLSVGREQSTLLLLDLIHQEGPKSQEA